MSFLCNAAIFAVTIPILASTFRKNGVWSLKNGLPAFRYFTVLSNALCALAALAVCAAELAGGLPDVVWGVKYVGTAAVTVTLLTVLLFLGPSQGGYKGLFNGTGFFLHLVCPLLALLSFVLWEKREMDYGTCLWGMLPALMYGILYLYKVVFAPPEKRWPDFYGFNKGGRWPITFSGLIAGVFLVCTALWTMQNA